MSRLPVLLVALMAAACASSPRTANEPRVDGSSAATFIASVKSMRQTLPTQRSTFLVLALQDIWRTTEAEAAPGSSDDDQARTYFGRVDGLGYKEIIALADATPPTVREQYYASLPRPSWHGPIRADMGSTTAGPDYTGYGLQGVPQYATSCGSVCSR